MARLDYPAIVERADRGAPHDATLSALSIEIILDMLTVYSDRWQWEAMDDSTWDEASDAIAQVEAEILENV